MARFSHTYNNLSSYAYSLRSISTLAAVDRTVWLYRPEVPSRPSTVLCGCTARKFVLILLCGTGQVYFSPHSEKQLSSQVSSATLSAYALARY
eukprot:1867419-Rhodomonas_salina.1